MTPKALLEEIMKLPPEDRLRLIEDAWDSLVTSPEAVPVPEWHKAELDQLLDHPVAEPPIPWERSPQAAV